MTQVWLRHSRLQQPVLWAFVAVTSWVFVSTLVKLPGKWLFGVLCAASFLLGLWIFRIARRGFELLVLLGLFSHVDARVGWSEQEPLFSPGIPLTLTLLALVPLYIMWAYEGPLDGRSRGHALFPSLVFSCVTLLLLVAAGSALWAPHFQPVFHGLVFVAGAFLAFWYFSHHLRSQQDIHFLVQCVCFGMVVTSGIAVVQYVAPNAFDLSFLGAARPWTEAVGTRLELRRVTGLDPTPNELARSLAVWLPVAMLFSVSEQPIQRKLLPLLAAGAGCIALVITYSRGGMITFVSVIAVGVLLWVLRGSTRSALGRGSVRLVVLGFCLLLIASPMLGNLYQRLIIPDDGQAESRVLMNEIAYRLIADNFLTGVGLNSYRFRMSKYDLTSGNITDTFVYPVHNFYLLLTGELGIFALLAFIGLTLHLLWRGLRSPPWMSAPAALLSFASLLGIVAFLINGFVEGDSFASNMMLHYWLSAAFLIGAERCAPRLPAAERAAWQSRTAVGGLLHPEAGNLRA